MTIADRVVELCTTLRRLGQQRPPPIGKATMLAHVDKPQARPAQQWSQSGRFWGGCCCSNAGHNFSRSQLAVQLTPSRVLPAAYPRRRFPRETQGCRTG
eukprot:6583547-Prymnesium_polylepis.1